MKARSRLLQVPVPGLLRVCPGIVHVQVWQWEAGYGMQEVSWYP